MSAAMREAAAKVAENRAAGLKGSEGTFAGARRNEALAIAAAIRALPVPQAEATCGLPADVLERAQRNWHRVFYTENKDFVDGCGCLSPSVAMAVADSLREVLNWLAGQDATDDPMSISAGDMSKKPENLGTSDEHVKDVERVAQAIQNVRGGVNYDYADFCRDAARAAIAALPRDQIEAKDVEIYPHDLDPWEGPADGPSEQRLRDQRLPRAAIAAPPVRHPDGGAE